MLPKKPMEPTEINFFFRIFSKIYLNNIFKIYTRKSYGQTDTVPNDLLVVVAEYKSIFRTFLGYLWQYEEDINICYQRT